jgi:IS5 family transposase
VGLAGNRLFSGLLLELFGLRFTGVGRRLIATVQVEVVPNRKARKPVEFGHKVFLAESAQGLITDYQVLEGNPADTTQVKASLERHLQIFHCAPDLYAGDRGFYSAENEKDCQEAGVSRVCIPQRGGQKTAERGVLETSPAFKKGQRFRVGIEGRISVLFRGRGMKRCRAQGRERFAVLVGAAVLANNLLRIAAMLRDGKPARAKKAA